MNGDGVRTPVSDPLQRNRVRTTPGQALPSSKSTQPISVKIDQPDESIATMAGHTLTPLLHPLTTIFVVLIFLVFMLLARDDLRDRGLRIAGKGRMHVTTKAIEDASRRVSRYLRMQLIVNLCYGAVVGLLLWAIGVPNPLLWAVLTCLLRFVPYIGILLAAAGPLLLSIAVSPHWSLLIWTAFMYIVLELVAANFVEPMLYGASTGISPIGVLIAAIFWTLLWGLPGLLLSTPLTVCLVVIGRQVSHLQYLDLLFGDNEALAPPDRFYQRMLASNARDATTLLEETLKTKSVEQAYDGIVVPAITLIEEARHSEEMTGAHAEELLQNVEEITEDVFGKCNETAAVQLESKLPRQVVCVPARDFADEVACQLAAQVLSQVSFATALSADTSTAEVLQSLESSRPDAICVVGIPPHAIRHLRMRCHQIRAKFPTIPLVACILSEQCDLSKLKVRIPSEDAQHVVCSLQLMKDYLLPLLGPVSIDAPADSAVSQEESAKELADSLQHMQLPDVFDEPKETVFNHLTMTLARAFDAPIALITVTNGQRRFWESRCGLPDDLQSTDENECDRSICSRIVLPDSGLVIGDIATDKRFERDRFLKESGIRFYAGAPLKSPEGKTMGSICVLDTRPRELGEERKDLLVSVANAVVQAIELHSGETSEVS
ncbi:AI-2E family transporter [Alloacidobacterium dinghuense]|uniref:AI-2E family transporter n=1 Tax=Alloacidobacterium dinghuense TaxID=2763107 RepID=UPI003D808BE0